MKIKIKLYSGQTIRFEGKNIDYQFEDNCLIVTICKDEEYIRFTTDRFCFPMSEMKYFYIATKGAK